MPQAQWESIPAIEWVNSFARLNHFDALGADSFDGSQFSMFPQTYIPRYLARLTHQQLGLLEEAA